MAPLLQLVMLGYAATTDVRDVPMIVVDQDRSTVIGLDEKRGTQTPVARVLRAARMALAADHRYAVRRAGPEESDVQSTVR